MIDKSMIEYLAELSKIEISEQDKEKFSKEMQAIINLMDTIVDIDTSFIADDKSGINISDLRADDIIPSMPTKEITKNAPVPNGNFYEIPKVVE